MKRKKTKLLSIALCMLVISTPLVLVVSAGTPQDGNDTVREKRVFIMGVGKISRGRFDKTMWVDCQPLCILVMGCGLGKRFLWPNDYISLLHGHFVGFFIPINGIISPLIGLIDYEQIIDEFY